MAGQMESEPLGDVALKHLDGLELELDDVAALRADEMVVVLSLERTLVAGALAVRHQRHLKQPGLDQQRKDSVHRRGVHVR